MSNPNPLDMLSIYDMTQKQWKNFTLQQKKVHRNDLENTVDLLENKIFQYKQYLRSIQKNKTISSDEFKTLWYEETKKNIIVGQHQSTHLYIIDVLLKEIDLSILEEEKQLTLDEDTKKEKLIMELNEMAIDSFLKYLMNQFNIQSTHKMSSKEECVKILPSLSETQLFQFSTIYDFGKVGNIIDSYVIMYNDNIKNNSLEKYDTINIKLVLVDTLSYLMNKASEQLSLKIKQKIENFNLSYIHT